MRRLVRLVLLAFRNGKPKVSPQRNLDSLIHDSNLHINQLHQLAANLASDLPPASSSRLRSAVQGVISALQHALDMAKFVSEGELDANGLRKCAVTMVENVSSLKRELQAIEGGSRFAVDEGGEVIQALRVAVEGFATRVSIGEFCNVKMGETRSLYQRTDGDKVNPPPQIEAARPLFFRESLASNCGLY